MVELVSVAFSGEAPDRLTALRSFEVLLSLLNSLGDTQNNENNNNYNNSDNNINNIYGNKNGFITVNDWVLELRFVAVDVSTADTAECKKHLLDIIYPKLIHMDFNIAAPLYFAAR